MELLDALQESGREKEKSRIELAVQNKEVDPEEDEVIDKLLTKLEKWFGKTKIDEASDAWIDFITLKRATDEDTDKFLLRFETSEANLKYSMAEIFNPNIEVQTQLR